MDDKMPKFHPYSLTNNREKLIQFQGTHGDFKMKEEKKRLYVLVIILYYESYFVS